MRYEDFYITHHSESSFPWVGSMPSLHLDQLISYLRMV